MKRNFVVFYSPFIVINLIFLLFSLNVEVAEVSSFLKEKWQETMISAIDMTTLRIIAQNLLVNAYLWVLPIYLMWIAFKKPRCMKEKQGMLKLVYIVYLGYFIKITLQTSLSLFDFQHTNVSYVYSLLTLILPHGLTEIAALALTAAFTIRWMSAVIKKDRFEWPQKKSILGPNFVTCGLRGNRNHGNSLSVSDFPIRRGVMCEPGFT